jgi:hypothetical protein
VNRYGPRFAGDAGNRFPVTLALEWFGDVVVCARVVVSRSDSSRGFVQPFPRRCRVKPLSVRKQRPSLLRSPREAVSGGLPG